MSCSSSRRLLVIGFALLTATLLAALCARHAAAADACPAAGTVSVERTHVDVGALRYSPRAFGETYGACYGGVATTAAMKWQKRRVSAGVEASLTGVALVLCWPIAVIPAGVGVVEVAAVSRQRNALRAAIAARDAAAQ